MAVNRATEYRHGILQNTYSVSNTHDVRLTGQCKLYKDQKRSPRIASARNSEGPNSDLPNSEIADFAKSLQQVAARAFLQTLSEDPCHTAHRDGSFVLGEMRLEKRSGVAIKTSGRPLPRTILFAGDISLFLLPHQRLLSPHSSP